ncbi:nucleotidyltransferase [Bacillus sp. ISL-35]|uniref:nucleotidyltransferase n=1 Tax=Bacillus sp. ISL-35 TaxID=2819122 RepID=UPI001BEBBD0E|nr:nucleotidyltransferase [Bacillus sp. ISL-35]MBT2678457.1 nucleotidyltransferase [Bacillus sp. ISL-35]MBT2701706.1 nucleotidyltransferase [Chryseobacterium sp. ISL-80]
MKAVGVVVEYNPFHNGHLFHLQQAKEQSGSDIAIAAMSGNFLQRGEPALVSKWTRTKMALDAGVDIVFELPYRFATQHAEVFAEGAVSILSGAGCETLCFGSESGDLNAFIQTISFLEANNDFFQEKIRFFAGEGNSYPKSIALAFQALAPAESFIDISKPNNILGMHYIQAILRQDSQMTAQTITRKNAGYHDEHFASATIASATSIRKALFGASGEMEAIRQYVPDSTYKHLISYKEEYGGFHSWENYWPFLKYRLLQSSPKELNEFYEVEEGLENRLLAAAAASNSFQQFMESIKTKRYTWTRLQRVCLHILTNTRKDQMNTTKNTVNYLRLLGATEKGRSYLNLRKKDFSLPLVSKLSAFSDPDLELDTRAARIYALGQNGSSQEKLLAKEFAQPPIMLKG